MILISDSKYGYRGEDNILALKLINSAIYPDPYPERGIHHVTLWLGVCRKNPKEAENLATVCNHSLIYQPSNCHTGTLPMENSLLKVSTANAVVSGVIPQEDGSILVRVYEAAGSAEEVCIAFTEEVKDAVAVNLMNEVQPGLVRVEGKDVYLKVDPYSLGAVKVTLA